MGYTAAIPGSHHDTLSALATLPFGAQLRLIDGVIERVQLRAGERAAEPGPGARDAADSADEPGAGGRAAAEDDAGPRRAPEQAVAELIERLVALRDHEPLAYAVVQAAQAGLLPDAAEAVAAGLLRLPDTGVQRVLRALNRVAIPAPALAVVVAAVRAALETLPIARVAALCLLDRWLKNAAPTVRAALVDDAARELEAALGGGAAAIDAISDELLMRVPGRRLAELAGGLDDGDRAKLDARLQRFAGRVLDILGAAPKSLSQANAEEILSRRVYTDPGHFLVELLQNAEDAGARAWRVDIGARDLAVWHDGVPFDAKDVVGVLSIGQTTKDKDQIGFFGVGFKSVYEVCERPQVYSGPFCFEIADVSIPRWLETRPSGRPGDGTLLILVLRDPADPVRNPEALYRHALAVPPETLLTLRHLRELAVARGAKSRTVRAEAVGASRVDLVEVESARRTGYVVVRDRYEYGVDAGLDDGAGEGGAASEELAEEATARSEAARSGASLSGGRERSRAAATDVLVGVRLDERGMPVALPADAATIYGYLPTRERSGLQFLIHAHFDLPVDRERLDLESHYNRWVLVQAGRLVARAARAVIAADGTGEGRGDAADDGPGERGDAAATADDARAAACARATATLALLPLADELAHPAYVALAEATRRALAGEPCLPGADGQLLPPERAALVDDAALSTVLAGVDLDGRGWSVLSSLPARARAQALQLGARELDAAGLIALVARDPACIERCQPRAEGSGELILLQALARDAGHAALSSLREARFVRDSDGVRRAPADLARASRALRAVYALAEGEAACTRHFIAAELDALCAEDGAVDVDVDVGAAAVAAALTPLWQGLAVSVVDEAALLADLRDPEAAAALMSEAGVARVVAYLSTRPKYLGMFIDALASGAIALEGRDGAGSESPGLLAQAQARVVALHRALDAVADELTPKLQAKLARAALFPDRRGRLRPLTGADAALLPADDDIVALAPEAPWLAEEVAGLAYVAGLLRQLGVAACGPAAVAGALLLDELRLFDATDDDAVRRAHGYLCQRAEDVPGRLRSRLAAEAVWFSAHGQRAALGQLRRPPERPVLASFYRAWGDAEVIDVGGTGGTGASAGPGSSLALADALGLGASVGATDFDAFVSDIVRMSRAGDEAGEVVARLRPLIVPALVEAAQVLPRERLMRAAEAAVFLPVSAADDSAGGAAEPGTAPPDVVAAARFLPLSVAGGGTEIGAACVRAAGEVRVALAHGSQPLLDAADEEQLAAFLDAAGVSSAGIAELVHAVESDAAMRTARALDAARRALVARHERLAACGVSAARLAALPLWPGLAGESGGDYLAADSVIRARAVSALAAAPAQMWEQSLAARGRYAVLDERAAGVDADALSEVIEFADPRAALEDAAAALGCPGQPMSEQPALLADAERVAHLARVIAAGGGDVGRLPLAVDAAGCLVFGPLLTADEHERAIAHGLPLYQQLADPRWAEIVGVEVAPRLSIRQLLAALAEDAAEAMAIEAHPRLREPERRRAVYAWLIAHGEAIVADDQARGLVGRAAVIATPGGMLRPVRTLLLDPSLPDLGIDWNAADEVPAVLVGWLRRHFAPGEKQLGRLVDSLMKANEAAVRAGDHAQSAALVGHLAHSMRVGEAEPRHVTAAVRRFQLRKRLRVSTDGGEFARPRTLLVPAPDDWALLRACAQVRPARVADALCEEPAVRALIAHAGAAERLGDERLRALIDGTERQEGAAAAMAMARYVAAWAGREPELRDALDLAKVAWIPDGDGALKPARRLYSPGDGDARLVVGAEAGRYPHPGFVHTAPPALLDWLPFRRVDDADLADVVAHLDAVLAEGRERREVGEIWWWIDRALERGHVRPDEVREALSSRRCLCADDGSWRLPGEVARAGARALFGPRRADWSEGDEYTRLATALKIAKRPGKREVIGYLDEISADIVSRAGADGALAIDTGSDVVAAELINVLRQDPRGGAALAHAAAALLAAEPELIAALPSCLERLAQAGGAVPGLMPLVCEDVRGEPQLCVVPDERVYLPLPPEAFADAVAAGSRALFPRLPEGDGEAALALLAELGVPTLAPMPASADGAGVRAGNTQRSESARARDNDNNRRASRDPAREDASPAEFDRADDDDRRLERSPGRNQERDPERDRRWRPPDDEREQLPERPSGLVSRIRSWLAPPPDEARDRERERARRERERREIERAYERDQRRDDERNPARDRRRDRLQQRSNPGAGSSGAGASGAGGDRDGAGPAPDAPPVAPDQRLWFRPRQRIGSQMHDHSAWGHDRQSAAAYGLAFQPRALPQPYLYAPHTIAGRFQSAGQRWVAIHVDPAWRRADVGSQERAHGGAPPAAGEHTMSVRGRIPVGEVLLPTPMFGRIVDVDASPPVRLFESRTGAAVVVTAADTDIRYRVALPPVPDYDRAATEIAAPEVLSAATVSDRELPDEALRFADELLLSSTPLFERALAVREFVRARYVYDPSYLESPEVARWLERLSRGRSNAHIAALHAGRDGRHLGRGVCYELNVMACELLRRSGVPAVVTTGWTFDRGHLDEPDHLWAMALVPAGDGPRWLPIDASTTREGRPLHVGRRPPGSWGAPAAAQRSSSPPSPPPPAPAWAEATQTRRFEPDPVPIGDLVRVLRHLEEVTGEALGDSQTLRERGRELLGDPARARELVTFLRGYGTGSAGGRGSDDDDQEPR